MLPAATSPAAKRIASLQAVEVLARMGAKPSGLESI
jgi:hypothetical protein